jgi:hypothetical protein
LSAAAIASGTIGAGSRSGAITCPYTPAQRIAAIQDAKDLVERFAKLGHRFTRGDIGETISRPKGGAHGNNTLSQRYSVGIAKLRRPGAVGQESGSGSLVNEFIKDPLEQLGCAEPGLIERWIGVAREVGLSHRYSSE